MEKSNASMDHTALSAKVKAEGEGVIITDAMLEGCSFVDSIDELFEMEPDNAAGVAGHIFSKIFGVKVEQSQCDGFNLAAMEWSGTVEGYEFEIIKDGDGWFIDFSEA